MQTKFRNQVAKYLLTNWMRLENRIDQLDLINQACLKILRSGLEQLPDDERQLLKEKYYHEEAAKTDAEMSRANGLSMQEYAKKRVAIEKKLTDIVLPYMKKLNKMTGFAPYYHKRKKSRDGYRRDVVTGVRYINQDGTKG